MKNSAHYLRNHLSKKQATENLLREDFQRTVISFYRYVRITDPVALRNALFAQWQDFGVLGRVYLAEEGINAQVSVPSHLLEKFQEKLFSHNEFKNVPFKVGVLQEHDAFWKLTIKVKRQIVADGLTAGDYDVTNVGAHLSAKEFNQTVDEGAVVVDMRNNYESAIGKFDGAITPNAYTFREELPMVAEMLRGKEGEDIILYCTGGIRCEKASAYLKHKGFKKVSQLLGGIIDYKHQVEREGLENKFKGKNFVFDDRMGERISPDVLGKCYHCKAPCDDYINCAETACNLLFLECSDCQVKLQGFCSKICKEGEYQIPIEKNGTLYRRSIGLTA